MLKKREKENEDEGEGKKGLFLNNFILNFLKMNMVNYTKYE